MQGEEEECTLFSLLDSLPQNIAVPGMNSQIARLITGLLIRDVMLSSCGIRGLLMICSSHSTRLTERPWLSSS